jgi:curved DNA-binding protein
MRDYYQILGIKRNASEKEIKSAFRKLARKFHPDKNQNDRRAEETFKRISEAYEVLSDSSIRAKYDQVGHQAWKAGVKNKRPSTAWGGPHDFTGGFPGGFNVHSSKPGGFGGFDIEDLLGGMFAKKRRRKTSTPQAQHRNAKLEIPIRDAVTGCERRITITSETGQSESLTVKIPPGVREGQKIRLAGKGHKGLGTTGDLLIEIIYEQDPRFLREDYDLSTDLKVPFHVALLGGKAIVQTLEGSVEMTIPAGTQGGQRMRLKGKGLPKETAKRGDLFARIRIVLPQGLDDRGKELVEKLKDYMQ